MNGGGLHALEERVAVLEQEQADRSAVLAQLHEILARATANHREVMSELAEIRKALAAQGIT